MDGMSPNKRRALAPLDGNTRSPLPAPRLQSSPSKLNLGVPAKTKRIMTEKENEVDGSGVSAVKKRRLSGDVVATTPTPKEWPAYENPASKEVDDASRRRQRSPSVGDSSVCDTSTMDNTQITTITEPDVEAATTAAAAPAPATTAATTTSLALAPIREITTSRPRSLTREEARQKAEILRLRLGLASYKVKTNQTNLPLERLQIRPLPPPAKRPPKPIAGQDDGEVSLPPPLPAAQSLSSSTPNSTSETTTRQDIKTRHVSARPAAATTITTTTTRRALPSAPMSSQSSRPDLNARAVTAVGPDQERRSSIVSPASTNPNSPNRQLLGEEDDVAKGAVRGLLRLSQES